MTEERKIKLGFRVKEIGEELQKIAKEWALENGLSRVSIEVAGQYDIAYEGKESDTVVCLFENLDDRELHRFVRICTYLDEKPEEVFKTDRNDMVKKEEENDGKENTEE